MKLIFQKKMEDEVEATFEINGTSIKIRTIQYIVSILFNYFKQKTIKASSLKVKLIQLMGLTGIDDAINREDLFFLLNIGPSQFYKHIKEGKEGVFEDVTEKPPNYFVSDSTVEKESEIEEWLTKTLYSHYPNYYISFLKFGPLFDQFKKETNSNAGKVIFKRVYEKLHVHRAKRQLFDLFHCKKCHHNRYRILSSVDQHFNRSFFPFHVKDIHFLFENSKDILRWFAKLKGMWLSVTGHDIPHDIFNSIAKHLISIDKSWKLLGERLTELREHVRVNALQRYYHRKDIDLANKNANHFTFSLDFVKHYYNVVEKKKNKVYELIFVCFKDNKLHYIKFIPDLEYNLKKSNITLYAIKNIIETTLKKISSTLKNPYIFTSGLIIVKEIR